jgi:acetyl esterase/lipase
MKTKLILFALSLLVFFTSCTIRATPIPTVPPTPTPFPYAGQSLTDVTYCTMDGLPQKMDIYFPSSGGPWPVVVHVHGGAWMRGDKSEAAGLGAALNADGYVVAAVNYRLYPAARFPAYIEDVKCAVRFLRAHAAEYNLDPNRFAAVGASAGGHLVALLGTSDQSAGFDVGEYLDQSSRVQAVIDISGPSDLSQDFQNGDLATLMIVAFGSKQIAAASPVTHVTSDDSPFLILHGDNDGVVEVAHAYILNDALVAAGVPVTLVIVKNGDHSLTAADGSATPTQEEIWQMELDFLRANLK